MSKGLLPQIASYLWDQNNPIQSAGNSINNISNAVSDPLGTARSFLPTIGAVAAPVAADLVTGGTAIPADMALAAGGYNAGRALESKLGGPAYNPTSKENLINTALVSGTQGVGEGISQLGGKALQNSAEQATLNEFNPTPSIIKKFATQNGMSIPDAIDKFKTNFPDWTGKGTDFTSQVFDPLNTQYGENLQGLNVDRNAFGQDVKNRIALLSKQGGTSSNETASQLQAEYNDLMSKNKLGGKGPIDAPLFNSYKSDLYKTGSKVDFGKPVAQRDAQLQLADLMKSHLNGLSEQTGGDLGQTGRDLNAAHTLNDLANGQDALNSAGKARAPGGLLGTVIRAPLEAAVGAALGHTFGAPGMAIGAGTIPYLTETALRNPAISGASATLENALGKGLQSNVGEKVLPAIGNAGLQVLSKGVTNNQYNQPDNGKDNHPLDNTPNPEQNPPDIVNDPARDKVTGHWSTPPDIPKFSVSAADSIMTLPEYQKAQKDYQQALSDHAGNPLYSETDTKWMQSQKDLWDQSQQLRQSAVASRLPSEGVSFMQAYPNDLEATNAMKDIIKKYGTATGIQNMSQIIQKAESYNDPQVAVVQGMMRAQQGATTHETLGRVSNFDIGFLQNTANPDDSPKAALAKIDRAAKTDAIKARVWGGPYQYMIDQGLTNTPSLTSGGLPANTNGTLNIQQ